MNRDACPLGICSETGWINSAHQSIVCLPNEIIITLRENPTEKELFENIDGITN